MHIIAPYRDRESHLKQFISWMRNRPEVPVICIIEQTHGKPFNRGKLLNIGTLEYSGNYYCFHDVDMLPLTVDYSYPENPTQLASSQIQRNGYFGGVTMFNNQDFKLVNGYSNNFYSRAEDNELYFQTLKSGLKITNRFGKFKELEHERPAIEFDPVLWEKAQQTRDNTKDGLTNCKYQVIKILNASSTLKHIVVDM